MPPANGQPGPEPWLETPPHACPGLPADLEPPAEPPAEPPWPPPGCPAARPGRAHWWRRSGRCRPLRRCTPPHASPAPHHRPGAPPPGGVLVVSAAVAARRRSGTSSGGPGRANHTCAASRSPFSAAPPPPYWRRGCPSLPAARWPPGPGRRSCSTRACGSAEPAGASLRSCHPGRTARCPSPPPARELGRRRHMLPGGRCLGSAGRAGTGAGGGAGGVSTAAAVDFS